MNNIHNILSVLILQGVLGQSGQFINTYVAKLVSDFLDAGNLESLTILDGIYTNERGPLYDGNARRTDVLVASSDMLAADMVGSQILCYPPSEIPHLVQAARDLGKSLDPTRLSLSI